MSWIVVNIHRIMILSGVLTMTMVYAALAPEAALRSTFGESVSGPVADIVVRNWGALIALVGAMLIYGARKPAVRPMALTVAGASKAIFVALVLSHGGRFLGYQAGIAVLVDVLWVMVFAAYFLSVRRTPTGDLKVGSRSEQYDRRASWYRRGAQRSKGNDPRRWHRTRRRRPCVSWRVLVPRRSLPVPRSPRRRRPSMRLAAANNYLLPAWMIGFGVWLVIASFRTERPTRAHV